MAFSTTVPGVINMQSFYTSALLVFHTCVIRHKNVGDQIVKSDFAPNVILQADLEVNLGWVKR